MGSMQIGGSGGPRAAGDGHAAPSPLESSRRIRAALDRREMSVEYQPQVDLDTGAVVGAEALLRWHSATSPSVSPERIVPVAERSGQISRLTRFVLGTAVRQCAAWRRDGLDLRISVNLSPLNLLEPGLVDDVVDLLDESGLTPSALRLEITETTVMTDLRTAVEVMGRLRALGIGVAIDDFGTGFSSLAYLTSLPVDELKLDRAFLGRLSHDDATGTVVRAVIDLGRALGLEVVAEGVETTEHRKVLRAMGCPVAQGFLFASSMTPERFGRWVCATSGPAVEPAAPVAA
jgi:diguanylate cyclase